jgi:hypothetical protein
MFVKDKHKSISIIAYAYLLKAFIASIYYRQHSISPLLGPTWCLKKIPRLLSVLEQGGLIPPQQILKGTKELKETKGVLGN